MKRGLKSRHPGEDLETADVVKEPSPMKRGLKLIAILRGPCGRPYAVKEPSPMKRGLK